MDTFDDAVYENMDEEEPQYADAIAPDYLEPTRAAGGYQLPGYVESTQVDDGYLHVGADFASAEA